MNSFTYDPHVDCAYITLANPISSTICEEVGSGIILEYDATQTLIGIELLGVKTLTLYDLEPLSSILDDKIYVDLLHLLAQRKIDRFHTFL